MRFTLPAAPTPDAPDANILLAKKGHERYELRFSYVSDDAHPILVSLAWLNYDGGAYLGRGEGATPAEALLSLLSDADGEMESTTLPADVAAALDELAHQAVRIVCDRLCGGELDSATESERTTPVFRTGDPSRLVFDIGNAALLPSQFVVGVIVGYEDPDNPAAMRSKVSVEEAIHPRLVAAAFKGVAEHMSALAVEQDVALLDTQTGPVQHADTGERIVPIE